MSSTGEKKAGNERKPGIRVKIALKITEELR